MKRRSKTYGPQFVRYFDPVLHALRELGGSGRPNEVIDFIAQSYGIPDELSEELASGGTRFDKYIHWARFYLAKDGFIDSSQRGVWTLTAKGRNEAPLGENALVVFQRVQDEVRNQGGHYHDESSSVDVRDEIALAESDLIQQEHRVVVLERLRSLSSSGFERFCQLLLRVAGFEQVTVTGRSGDGGIDGHGILKLNQFVSFQIAFQSKRYGDNKTIGTSVVRDFRGAMMGRADKGIILTTGTFSADAQREAVRDGATPIELVDGEQILDMMEELEIGLRKKPIIVYEIDRKFFDDFE